MIAPHIQATGARGLFPCWDEPYFKTTFTISVKHHRKFTALCNMPIQAQYIANHDLMWTHFNETPPISTYQVSIVMSNSFPFYINENINLLCLERQILWYNYAEQIIKNITLHLESEFNEIKISKMDHITIPNFPYRSMSKLGLIFHR